MTIKNNPIIIAGDCLDRLSILHRRILRDKDNTEAKREYQHIKEYLRTIVKDWKIFLEMITICEANYAIWELESDIRNLGEKTINKLGLEEIGKRALTIREHNKRRVNAKNKINELTKTGFSDKKVDHKSE